MKPHEKVSNNYFFTINFKVYLDIFNENFDLKHKWNKLYGFLKKKIKSRKEGILNNDNNNNGDGCYFGVWKNLIRKSDGLIRSDNKSKQNLYSLN